MSLLLVSNLVTMLLQFMLMGLGNRLYRCEVYCNKKWMISSTGISWDLAMKILTLKCLNQEYEFGFHTRSAFAIQGWSIFPYYNISLYDRKVEKHIRRCCKVSNYIIVYEWHIKASLKKTILASTLFIVLGRGFLWCFLLSPFWGYFSLLCTPSFIAFVHETISRKWADDASK